ncbi:hypothetical protein [Streptomyces sp. NPDC018031]|uniref:hypothetical protein n=1 Tax=Streptomyces sp. NPDC018031 TaxID=3365033 RepID=UPI0037B3F0A3
MHNAQFHRVARLEDLLSPEQIDQVASSPLSEAQGTVLWWAQQGKLAEYEDGFFGLDVSPDKWDVNKKIARKRVIALWAAGLLRVESVGDPVGHRDLYLSRKGHAFYGLWSKARRQSLVDYAPKDNTFDLTSKHLARYPLLSKGQLFTHEQTQPATPSPTAAEPQTDPPPGHTVLLEQDSEGQCMVACACGSFFEPQPDTESAQLARHQDHLEEVEARSRG